jgi:hypothetical protein
MEVPQTLDFTGFNLSKISSSETNGVKIYHYVLFVIINENHYPSGV